MSRPISILLVDDEAKNLVALESILDSTDYELVKAQTANEALLALMEREYAAIVLDVHMPDLGGIELARLIKQRKKTQHIPILFLTAYYQEDEQIVQGYGAGAVDYLTKPVNPSVLRSKIGVFLDLFQKTRALAEMNRAMTGEIGERQKAEEALRSANTQLETKNAELEGQAEERFRRIRAEAAQAEAEAARERSALLAEAGKVFASSFETETTLRALARLVVPRLSECCLVDVAGEDEQLAPVVVFHVDRRREQKLSKLWPAFLARLHAEGGLPAALQSGAPMICPLGEEAGDISEEGRALRDELQLSSCVIVPLRARERTLGCLYLGQAAPRVHRDADASLAQALAERAALALDNARLYTEAQQARATAEAANAAKDRFLAMLSHELRTPLSPVLHAVTLLEQEADVPPPVRELLSTIYRNVQLEARLIDDLLDLARIRNGKLQLQPEPVDAHDLLRRAAEICRPEIERGNLRLAFALEARETRLLADPARVQQIFWNLITNAIKFTPTGGQIVLRSRDESGGSLRVEISDTGCGIARPQIGKIFDAFEQADRRGSTGLGLGLAICKALAELHGGSIEAESPGSEGGSTFGVRLPVARAGMPEAAPAAPEGKAVSPAHLRLLLVEDHADTAAMLRRLLVRRGYEVRAAETVAGALETARDYPLDVLLSDIGLPDGTGIDLMQRLIEQKGGLNFRGIALSGFGMTEDLQRSKNAGFSEHLTKPVDFHLLERTLAHIAREMAVP